MTSTPAVRAWGNASLLTFGLPHAAAFARRPVDRRRPVFRSRAQGAQRRLVRRLIPKGHELVEPRHRHGHCGRHVFERGGQGCERNLRQELPSGLLRYTRILGGQEVRCRRAESSEQLAARARPQPARFQLRHGQHLYGAHPQGRDGARFPCRGHAHYAWSETAHSSL